MNFYALQNNHSASSGLAADDADSIQSVSRKIYLFFFLRSNLYAPFPD